MRNSVKLDDEVDGLFKLPLSEFVGERNTLAAKLKQTGRADDANFVKTLAKPSISAWTVNQLYWHHRAAFDKLLAAGQRFHKAQTSSLAGKVTDMRGALDARRDALAHLSDLATSLLTEAGHNPSLETIRRITTTLEAISALASVSDGPTLGRLTQDVDPPGFESLASFVVGAPAAKREPAPPKLTAVPTKSQQQKADERRIEQERQMRIAAAKLSVQTAKKSLAAAQVKAQNLEKQLVEAEERYNAARAASKAAVKEVEDAKRVLDKTSKELQSLFSGNS
ncbi:MAG TPA: hypothetical protein VHH35_01975 [Pyrinomonadaceae bacterium]|nr:hypothetical protein [Pyrinomonadaceae bacterium]